MTKAIIAPRNNDVKRCQISERAQLTTQVVHVKPRSKYPHTCLSTSSHTAPSALKTIPSPSSITSDLGQRIGAYMSPDEH